MRQPQTPSFTKSPSTCGGKCFVGFLSHSRICSLRSFARARIAIVDIILRLGNSLIIIPPGSITPGSSLVARYCLILRRVIELCLGHNGRRILALPLYSPPDCLRDFHRLLVSQFLADARRTRGPVLRGVAGLLQMSRRPLGWEDNEFAIPLHLAGDLPGPLQFAKRGLFAHVVDSSCCAFSGCS